jgi:thioredoxin reductase
VAEPYDVIVAGGGPAGLSAALMLGRCRRRVLLCDLGEPRNRCATALHGYLTRDGMAPAAFNACGRSELARYGVETRPCGVTDAHPLDHTGFRVALSDGAYEHARFLLIATGVVDDLPPFGGAGDCYGRSIFHCPYCDGWEWRDRRLAAYGRSGASAKLALALTTWSHDVVVCSDGDRMPRRVQERLARHGIAVRAERVTRVAHDAGALHAIEFESGPPLERDALFFTTGQHPQSDLAARLGCALTRRGTVKTANLCDTNVPRVFVAGDASRDAQFVIVAAAEGVKAAVAVNKALEAEHVA